MLDVTFYPNTQEILQIMYIIPVGSMKTRRYFPPIRWFHKWVRNGMLTNLFGDLAINAMHGSMILILKTSICNVFMGIHHHKEMA